MDDKSPDKKPEAFKPMNKNNLHQYLQTQGEMRPQPILKGFTPETSGGQDKDSLNSSAQSNRIHNYKLKSNNHLVQIAFKNSKFRSIGSSSLSSQYQTKRTLSSEQLSQLQNQKNGHRSSLFEINEETERNHFNKEVLYMQHLKESNPIIFNLLTTHQETCCKYCFNPDLFMENSAQMTPEDIKAKIYKERPLSVRDVVRSNLKKYIQNNESSYQARVINDLLFSENMHIVSIFKDYLIFDECTEFLKRPYECKESIQRLPKIYNFYEKCSKVFPNYIVLTESKYMFKNIERKQRAIDDQQLRIYGMMRRKKRRAMGLDKTGDNKMFTSQFMMSVKRQKSHTRIYGIPGFVNYEPLQNELDQEPSVRDKLRQLTSRYERLDTTQSIKFLDIQALQQIENKDEVFAQVVNHIQKEDDSVIFYPPKEQFSPNLSGNNPDETDFLNYDVSPITSFRAERKVSNISHSIIKDQSSRDEKDSIRKLQFRDLEASKIQSVSNNSDRIQNNLSSARDSQLTPSQNKKKKEGQTTIDSSDANNASGQNSLRPQSRNLPPLVLNNVKGEPRKSLLENKDDSSNLIQAFQRDSSQGNRRSLTRNSENLSSATPNIANPNSSTRQENVTIRLVQRLKNSRQSLGENIQKHLSVQPGFPTHLESSTGKQRDSEHSSLESKKTEYKKKRLKVRVHAEKKNIEKYLQARLDDIKEEIKDTNQFSNARNNSLTQASTANPLVFSKRKTLSSQDQHYMMLTAKLSRNQVSGSKLNTLETGDPVESQAIQNFTGQPQQFRIQKAKPKSTTNFKTLSGQKIHSVSPNGAKFGMRQGSLQSNVGGLKVNPLQSFSQNLMPNQAVNIKGNNYIDSSSQISSDNGSLANTGSGILLPVGANQIEDLKHKTLSISKQLIKNSRSSSKAGQRNQVFKVSNTSTPQGKLAPAVNYQKSLGDFQNLGSHTSKRTIIFQQDQFKTQSPAVDDRVGSMTGGSAAKAKINFISDKQPTMIKKVHVKKRNDPNQLIKFGSLADSANSIQFSMGQPHSSTPNNASTTAGFAQFKNQSSFHSKGSLAGLQSSHSSQFKDQPASTLMMRKLVSAKKQPQPSSSSHDSSSQFQVINVGKIKMKSKKKKK